MPQPGPEHKWLAEMVGEWACVMNSGGQESKGTMRVESVCNGMWIATHFEGVLVGEEFEGRGMTGFDQHKKRYVEIWCDAMSSAPVMFEGSYDMATMTLTMKGQMADPLSGSPVDVVSRTVFKDKDHHTFQIFVVGPDGDESEMMSIAYTRSK